jgi:hypothetical protein
LCVVLTDQSVTGGPKSAPAGSSQNEITVGRLLAVADLAAVSTQDPPEAGMVLDVPNPW